MTGLSLLEMMLRIELSYEYGFGWSKYHVLSEFLSPAAVSAGRDP